MTTVLVNLTWLVPGIVGGSEESTTDALRAVVRSAPADIELRLAVLEPFASAHPDLAEALPCEVLALDGRDKVRRVLAEQTWLAERTVAVGADVVHHAGGVVPLRHPGSVVLTVHDLQPLDMPSNFSVAKRTYIRAMLGRSAAAAGVVCVPSRFTADRVVDRLGVDPSRVAVVPWSLRPPPGPDAGGELPAGLGDGPVVLYPAITYPHKNHRTLLEAFALLVRRHPDATLVLTGGEGSVEPEVRARSSRADLAGRVVRTGRVPRADLEALYRRADLVCVPSRYEGFGLPVLEAMVRGVPVLAADAGSLPEVARPADLVPVDDVAAWASAMHRALQADEAEHSARVAEARARASELTPERTATALVDAYRRAASTASAKP